MPEKFSSFKERLSSTPPEKIFEIVLESNKSTEELRKLINSDKQDEETLKKARTLIESGFANIDAISQNKSGDCLIHTAVKKGNDKMVALLVEYGCDVNARTDFNLTPLHLAVEREGEENKVLKELLKAENIDFNAKDTDGKTPDTRALLLGNLTAFQTLSSTISKKETKEKQEKEWQQKWEGKFEYDNPNKTDWEKEFDKLPKNSSPLDYKNPFDKIGIDKAFDAKNVGEAFNNINKSSLEAAAKSFDSQIATTQKTEAQAPEVKKTKIVKKPISEETPNTSDETNKLLEESKNNTLEEIKREQKEGFTSMFLKKIGEFIGLTKKEEKTPLLENQSRSTSVENHTSVEKIETEKLVVTDQVASPIHQTSKDVMSKMNESDRNEIERITQSLKKGNTKTLDNEVDSPLHSHVNSITHNNEKTHGGARQ